MLVLSLLLLVFMVEAIPQLLTAWADRAWVDEMISNSRTLEQLQNLARNAGHRIEIAQQGWAALYGICSVAVICMIAFFAWSLFSIRRMLREESSDHDA